MINSLKSMGAEIELMQNTLTLHKGISGFSEVEIEASQSSQFGSAFMLIAPLFPGEKKIRLTGTIASATYLQMTAKVLKEFGIDSVIDGSEIRISNGAYLPQKIQIEKDWSAAAFIYALVAVFDGPETIISGLSEDSLQGDIQVTEIFRELGVETIFTANGVIIRRTGSVKRYINFDFEDCPDLAPPVLTACAALNIDVKIRGLENLRFKESDRIDALKSNLNKFGKDLKQDGDCWILDSKLPMPASLVQIDDYNDHRIAMAFSVFTRTNSIQIQNPDCVNKSFPGFWKECKPWFNMEL
jgi:3-phosphoshikimate 1-carboxyvinyltransferase